MKNTITIVINGQQKEVEKRSYSFQEVIMLAYGSYNDAMQSYTMTSTMKNDANNKHSISYSLGDEIKMKEGLRINVDSSNRS